MSFSRSVVPSSNKSSGSVLNYRPQEPHKMSWPDGWLKGNTESWLRSQPSTKFTHLQYRKEREGPFFHEFIVVELVNDTVCRFDRRGDPRTRANAFTLEGITAEDTAHVIQKQEDHYAHIEESSDMLICVIFPFKQDLRQILFVCYQIQQSVEARVYTLALYNCYFFSWSIIVDMVRRVSGSRSLLADALNTSNHPNQSKTLDPLRSLGSWVHANMLRGLGGWIQDTNMLSVFEFWRKDDSLMLRRAPISLNHLANTVIPEETLNELFATPQEQLDQPTIQFVIGPYSV
ncbi:hypothetical protein FRC07_004595 [Ceratobasidium sp. 392]|nr:hypothetical protein FRC07_004595 [Ceratobasidium sp. 392]